MNLTTLQNGMIVMQQEEFDQLLEQAAHAARSAHWPMSAWKAMMLP